MTNHYTPFVLYREMIRSLEAENVDLKKNLSLAVSPQNDHKDKLVTTMFQELLEKQG